MDRSLARELARIARDEITDAAPPLDAPRSRQLRSQIEVAMQSSRSRARSWDHEAIDEDAFTPTSARASLKEGVRTPLELVRSELRARHPRRTRHAAEPGWVGSGAAAQGAAGLDGVEAPAPVAAPVAAAPAGANLLPAMA